jgi:hypothetical protein
MDNSPTTEKNRKINNKNYERSDMKTFPLVFLFFYGPHITGRTQAVGVQNIWT